MSLKSKHGANRKKSWKKIDIKDVEEYIEKKQLNEISGFDPASIPDSQLFTISRTPDDVINDLTNKYSSFSDRSMKSSSAVVSFGYVVKDTKLHWHSDMDKYLSDANEVTQNPVKKASKSLKKPFNQHFVKDIWTGNNDTRVRKIMSRISCSNVTFPTEGFSYNPSKKSKDELLTTLKKDLDVSDRRKRKVKRFFITGPNTLRMRTARKKIKSLTESKETDDIDVPNSLDKEIIMKYIPDRNKVKLRSERRKKIQSKMNIEEERVRKTERKIIKDINSIERIANNIVRSAVCKRTKKKRLTIPEHKNLKTINMDGENIRPLCESFSNLRNIQPMGNILSGRYSQLINIGFVNRRSKNDRLYHFTRKQDQNQTDTDIDLVIC